MKPAAALFLLAGACAAAPHAPFAVASVGAPAAADAAAGDWEDPVMAMQAAFGALAAAQVRLADAHGPSLVTAYYRDGALAGIAEEIDLGARGVVRNAYYFEADALSRIELSALRLSDAGAPSDGWYRERIAASFREGRFVAGEKRVDGAASEPDEHEIRAAAHAAQALREHVAGASAAPAPSIEVKGALRAPAPVALAPGAVARVELRDVARQDTAAILVQSAVFPISALPARYALRFHSADVPPNARLRLFVRVLRGENLLYVSPSSAAVDAFAGDVAAAVDLVAVDAPVADAIAEDTGG